MHDSVDSWDRRTLGKPYYHFYFYLPNRFSSLATRESQEYRQDIFDFKNGYHQEKIIEMMISKLKDSFPHPENLTLVCIPASTKVVNKNRYEHFCDAVCSNLHMQNGFPHITITQEKIPKHLGGDGTAEYSWDSYFFSGKKVLLFDDVVTQGRSMKSFIERVERMGGYVIGCMSIGRTYYDPMRDSMEYHPWSGRPVRNDTEYKPAAEVPVMQKVQPAVISTGGTSPSKPVTEQKTPLFVAEPKPASSAPTPPVPASKDIPVSTAPSAGSGILAKNEQKAAAVKPTVRAVSTKPKHAVGDRLKFGHYKGYPIEWIVLDVKEDRILVISRFGLLNRAFNDTQDEVSWASSSLRKWLNSAFLNDAFDSMQQARIIENEFDSDSLEELGIYESFKINDKVSLLSVGDYIKYFGQQLHWRCLLLPKRIDKQCWLRTTGKDLTRAAFIGRSGSIHAGGSLVNSDRNAVRPIMWLRS